MRLRQWNRGDAGLERSAESGLLGIPSGNELSNRYQANTGRRKCMLLLVLLIAGMIIVLIYKPRSSSSIPGPSSPTLSSPISAVAAAASAVSTEEGGKGTDLGSVADAVAGARPWIRPPSVPGYGGAFVADSEERRSGILGRYTRHP